MSFFVAGAVLVSGVLGSDASQSAASTQSAAATQAAQLQLQGVQESNALEQQFFNTEQGNLQPFMQGGQTAQNQLLSLLGPGGAASTPFKFTPTNDAYQFDLQQGLQALSQSAASKGILGTGGTAKDITNYAEGLASNEYQNEFGRYETQLTNQLSPLEYILGTGASAASGLSGLAGQTANALSANTIAGSNAAAGGITGAAQATAAGTVGSANALTSALGSGLSAYQQNNLLGYLKGLQSNQSTQQTLLNQSSYGGIDL